MQVADGRRRATYIWFSEKTSAMCSLSHSTSLRAENSNSSTSDCAICIADERSSATQAAEPTGRRAPRIVAMAGRTAKCNAVARRELL